MDLKLYFHIIRKRLWIFVLITVISALAAIGYYLFALTPMYSSTTMVYLNNYKGGSENNSYIDYNDLLAGQDLLNDFKEIITSEYIVNTSIKELSLENITAEQLAQEISVSIKSETRILTITVSDKDSINAQRIANSITNNFVKKVKEILPIKDVIILDSAIEAKTPSNKKPLIQVGVPIAVSCVFAALFIFFLEFIDNKFRGLDNISRYDPNIPVLGVIPNRK